MFGQNVAMGIRLPVGLCNDGHHQHFAPPLPLIFTPSLTLALLLITLILSSICDSRSGGRDSMAGSNPTAAAAGSDWYQSSSSSAQDPFSDARAALINMLRLSRELIDPRDVVDSPSSPNTPNRDPLLVLLPLLIILSSLLFFLLLFLIFVVFIRRRRGIILRDSDGPVDMSREELIDGEGGFEGVEERWLESVDEETRRAYRRAKGMSFRT